eukprot:CAMPEP_0180440160 /NCGR_PEP_ID=MMETSP1036_2-20121128/12963_1 /TAXON_ID=632150 /ORGANISM="Azadinium spinosum, Strain 3D9" /LENGTH=453 /DNA_ID=CAMNT_0022446327 /DNA_START=36 /DNA_END=1393 /DNA_ORIENTATION=+
MTSAATGAKDEASRAHQQMGRPNLRHLRSTSSPPCPSLGRQGQRASASSPPVDDAQETQRSVAGCLQDGGSSGRSAALSTEEFQSSDSIQLQLPGIARVPRGRPGRAAGGDGLRSEVRPVPMLSRSPPMRGISINGSGNPSPHGEEGTNGSEEDFVEGGIEILPTKDSSGCADGSFENESPVLTRQLLQLEQQELEKFWPRGDGPKALFLDYDGTLREFEARPELAVPTPELEELLAALDARQDLVPHIISGRDARFLEAHFGTAASTLIAEHGFEISLPGSERSWDLWEQYGGNVEFFRDHENWKAIMRSEIGRLVQQTPGSHLEEKRSSLVWHYREVANEAKAEAAAADVVEQLERLREEKRIQDVKISHGHKVVEVSYRNVRKGLVMRRLCEEKALFGQPFAGVLVAGDDVSDETMFVAAPEDVLTIKVGLGETSAGFRVQNPAQLRQFL